jgi:dipeptidyl aminopeptidase/acylaminoacyl peptidase
VAERIERDPLRSDRLNVSVSDNGVMVLAPYINRRSAQLLWLDRAGKKIGSFAEWQAFSRPWLSPDEKRFVAERRDPNGIYDLWLADVSGSNATRFTFDPGNEFLPVWSPDGSRIAFCSNREGPGSARLYQKAANGAGQEEPLLNVSGRPLDWSRDGRFIVYLPAEKQDVWVLPLDGVKQPFPLLQTEAYEAGAQLSPDGQCVAYV